MNPIKMANPVTVTKGALGVASSAVGVAGTVVRTTAEVVASVLDQLGDADESGTGADRQGAAGAVAPVNDRSGAGPTTAAAAAAAVTGVEGAPPGPTVVPAEPHAPPEPPIDVVGEALAAEAAAERGQGTAGAGLAHEPRGASRAEEHGEAALQRAEVDEISEEAAAALEDAVEPDAHLSEPLLDPAEAEAMAAELQTMSKAADPNKG
jgi:hypothetical protein